MIENSCELDTSVRNRDSHECMKVTSKDKQINSNFQPLFSLHLTSPWPNLFVIHHIYLITKTKKKTKIKKIIITITKKKKKIVLQFN